MDELSKQAAALQKRITDTFKQLKIEALNKLLEELRAASQQPGFWDDSAKAQDTMKQIAKLEARIKPWQELQKSINEVDGLLKLNDSSLEAELAKQLADL